MIKLFMDVCILRLYCLIHQHHELLPEKDSKHQIAGPEQEQGGLERNRKRADELTKHV